MARLPRPVTKAQIRQLDQLQRKALTKETKMQAFSVSCFRPGTLTAHMASAGGSRDRRQYAHECHFF